MSGRTTDIMGENGDADTNNSKVVFYCNQGVILEEV